MLYFTISQTEFADEAIIPSFDEEITLNYEYPERNKGFICIRINNVRAGKFVMDAFGVYKFYNDPRETQESAQYYVAELADRGLGFFVTEPALPAAFYKNQKAVLSVVKSQTNETVAKATEVEFETLAARVTADASRKTTTTWINLPNGFEGCNDYHNGDEAKLAGNGNLLKTYGSFLPYKMDLGDGSTTNFIMPFVYWIVPIKGSVRMTDSVAAGRVNKVFEEAVKSMPNMF